MTRSQLTDCRIGLNFAGKGLPFEHNLSGALTGLNKNSVAAIIVSRFGVAFLTEDNCDLKALCDGLPTFLNRAVNFAAKTRSGADSECEED